MILCTGSVYSEDRLESMTLFKEANKQLRYLMSYSKHLSFYLKES